MKRATLVLASFVAAFALGCGEPAPTIVQGTAADHGKALFSDSTITGTSTNTFSCATCHSPAGVASAAGSKLAGAPLAGVTRRPSYWGGMEVDLLPSVNHCLYYFMLASEPWGAEDERAQALYAYLDALPSASADEAAWPFTVDVEIFALPNGDAEKGRALYGAACGSCHGEAKTGAGRSVPRAPALPDDTLAEHPLDKYTPDERRLVFVQKTRHGGFLGYGGQMPPFSTEVLSDEELGDILGYLGIPTQ